jgi:hypothetical protein
MRVRVDALGAAPLLGFCNLGVGGPWSNFTNGLGSIYVNLLTGAMTSAISGAVTTTTYTNWTAAVVGDIVEVIMEFTNLDHYSLRIVKENKVGETSEVRHTYVPNSTGMHNICYAPAIMAGGTFRILAEETYTPESPMNKVVLHGDSYLSGAAIRLCVNRPWPNCVRYFLTLALLCLAVPCTWTVCWLPCLTCSS